MHQLLLQVREEALGRCVWRTIATYETEAGILDFHALRGTFAIMLSKSGVSPKAAQKLMRHSDIRLTMQT